MNIVFQGDLGSLPGLVLLWLTNQGDWPVALAYIVNISTILIMCLWIGLGVVIVFAGLMRYRVLTLVSVIAWAALLVVPSLEYRIWELANHFTLINWRGVLNLLMQICVLIALWLYFVIAPGRNWVVLRRWAIIMLVVAIGFVLCQAGLRVGQGDEDILGLPTYLPLAVRLREDIEWFVGIVPFVCGWLVLIASTRAKEQVTLNERSLQCLR